MRIPALLAVLVLLPAAQAIGSGDAAFSEHTVPVPTRGMPVFGGDNGTPEPTIGIPWGTDSLFFHSLATTMKATWDGDAPTWTDVTPPYQAPLNLDPMLHADPDTGRVWAGGLAGPCSVMMISDDDGATWVPAGNMCSGARFDHQSIGSGPHALPVPEPAHQHAAYYCGQLGAIACAASPDGGEAWGPFQDVPGPCGGFHGHIRVSRATGFVAVPVPDCGGDLGFISSADGGLTWRSQTIPGTEEWTNGFDPSLQFSRPGGVLYYGMASEHGVHVAVSQDEGATWEDLGAGGEAPHWVDVGAFHDPPVLAGTFADVQAGDDDRAAITFLGLEGGPGKDEEFLTSNGIFQCEERQDELVWHYYAALTYDAGRTWDVTRLTDDPVQVGGVYDVVSGGSSACRNLLDFNDMDIDSMGRVHVGWADGCVRECAETGAPGSDGYRADVGKVFRQTGGRTLFAAHDVPEPVVNTTAPPAEEPEEDTPLVPVAIVGLGLLAVAVRRR